MRNTVFTIVIGMLLLVLPKSALAQEIGAGYDVLWMNGNNMTDLHGPRAFVRCAHVVFAVSLLNGSGTGRDIPCSGLVLPGSGCYEQPVARDVTVVRGTVAYVIGRAYGDWKLEIAPRLGLGRVSGSMRGLASGRSLEGRQDVLELGLDCGVKRRFGRLPLWMGMAAHVGRARAVLPEDCVDCGMSYRSGYSSAGLSLFVSYALH